MKLTKNLLQDFCAEKGWEFQPSVTAKFRTYSGVRLYYPDCALSAKYLYMTDSDTLPAERDKALADICLVTGGAQRAEGFAYTIAAGCGLVPLFTALQAMHEQLLEWDRALSALLLNGGTLQEILDCSAPILRNPCFFEDEQFYVLASAGSISREDAPIFYDTVKSGRTPVHLFERVLSMSPQARAPYFAPSSVNVAQQLSPYKELLANCFVDGAVVLRFCMVCTQFDGNSLRDLVSHLMDRIENSPGIRSHSVWSTSSIDSFFSRVIETPFDPDVAAAAASLGLNRFDLFSVVCINFGTQTAESSAILTKLRMLLPNLCFFVYNGQPFALLGTGKKTGPAQDALKQIEELLFDQLDRMGSDYGVSLSFSELSALRSACDQAKNALSAVYSAVRGSEDTSPGISHMVRYQDTLLFHILNTFFQQYPFRDYCPRTLLDILKDDRTLGTNNLHLLYIYLSNECNATAASRILHMHRNNVIYRINKIEEKYQINFENNLDRQLLALLCLAVEYQCDLSVNATSSGSAT